MDQHLGQGTETEWNCFLPPGSGHQRHGGDREDRSLCGNLHPRGTEVALGDPGHAAPEGPGLGAVCRVLPPPGLLRVGRGLGGLCPRGGLLVFGAAFVFGTEAVVRLSPVFVAVVALRHRVAFVTAALCLGGRIEPVMILWVKPSSLARRPILRKEGEKRRQALDASGPLLTPADREADVYAAGELFYTPGEQANMQLRPG